MKKDRKIFVIVAIVAIVLVSFLIWRSGQRDTQTVFTFSCVGKKTISAVFRPDSVSLTLPKGRELNLRQDTSASGARYRNLDGSIVFWNKGETAFIEENGVATYTDCTVMK